MNPSKHTPFAICVLLAAACTAEVHSDPGEERVGFESEELSDGYYVGCFDDNYYLRALPNRIPGQHSVDSCVSEARRQGYLYAGLQWYGECWAGDRLAYNPRSDSECDTPCSVSPRQMCGGAYRNSVYLTNRLTAGMCTPIGSHYKECLTDDCFGNCVIRDSSTYSRDPIGWGTAANKSSGKQQAREHVEQRCQELYGTDCCCINYRLLPGDQWHAVGYAHRAPVAPQPELYAVVDASTYSYDVRRGGVLSIFGRSFSNRDNIVTVIQSRGSHVVRAGSAWWYESASQINFTLPGAVAVGHAGVMVQNAETRQSEIYGVYVHP